MKHIIGILVALTMAACSSLVPKTEELEASTECTVWKEGPLGTKVVLTVEGEVAKQKITCWVMNTFLCNYTDYFYKKGTSDILSSLPPADKVIGKLDGKRLSVNMKGITVEPFEFYDGRADYKLQGPIGPVQNKTVFYNKSCTVRQAALGTLATIGQ